MDIKAIKSFLKKLFHDISEKDIYGHASIISFTAIFSIFPLLFFLASVLGLVAGRYRLYDRLLKTVAQFIPADAYSAITNNVQQILPSKSILLVIIGLLISLYSASNIINVTIKLLNKLNGINDNRSIIKKVLLSMGFLIVFAFIAILVILFVIAGEVILKKYMPPFWGRSVLIAFIEIALYFLPFVLAVGYFYKKALNIYISFKNTLPGAIFFVLTFIIFSQIFRLAVVFMNVNKTYGAIGGIIIFLLWFQFIAFFFLVGTTINMNLLKR
ncbi:MAG: hypothetical protein DKM50_01435 [Candidatus Margulisiibacteriota bacterium]|nr:MAG: hypothetical protein A2X43_08375 [Candidatus Margulisbacteria bacterium GWD2_39_127]OGI01288.1 MAG: hypothetical protein A2X42_06010 [Candidatus Margulisbacteria bacterium GWF2_38_17]OGI09232.1 MAG: hypothetical protein A2X41_01495 [Candidatus Margulisbacteria bacterium GWE2_39_32]PZM83765.1 MAG: hypothetical protein DKM50_01435 [Candidatus Margulisiibacteriota bacterium]HAR63043.1 hypothetical protein [Candidatus Margulisiibacteriota bacterium]